MEKVLLLGWDVGLQKCLVLQPGGPPVVQHLGALALVSVAPRDGLSWAHFFVSPQSWSWMCFCPAAFRKMKRKMPQLFPAAPLAGRGSTASPGDLVTGGGEDLVSIPTSVQGESELGPLSFLEQTPLRAAVTWMCFALVFCRTGSRRCSAADNPCPRRRGVQGMPLSCHATEGASMDVKQSVRQGLRSVSRSTGVRR